MVFKQYINIPGVINSFKLLRNRNLIRPNLKLNSIDELNLHSLQNNYKIKSIVFDKDNTLTNPNCNVFSASTLTKLEDFKTVFGKENLAIISNTAGSSNDINYKDANFIENTLDIKVIRHIHQKPNVKKEVLDNFPNYKSEEICIIGDRLLIDILMGNQFGCFTILVEPLNPKAENIMIKFTRIIERILMKYFL